MIWGIFQLLLLLGGLFAGLYYLQKWMKQAEMEKRSDHGKIQIVDRMRLGIKDEVVLTKVGEDYLLYSSASGTFTKLDSKEFPEVQEAEGNQQKFAEFFQQEKPNIFQQIKQKVNEMTVKK